jgi:hypothetical protein
MSEQTIRILIAGGLFVHGVGHTLGFWKPAQSLFSLRIPETTPRIGGGIVWAAVAVGFVASAMAFYGVLVPSHWWRPLAITFAVISLIGLG